MASPTREQIIDHGRRPEDCDLIVCREHNRPECPVKVLELKIVVEKLNR